MNIQCDLQKLFTRRMYQIQKYIPCCVNQNFTSQNHFSLKKLHANAVLRMEIIFWCEVISENFYGININLATLPTFTADIYNLF